MQWLQPAIGGANELSRCHTLYPARLGPSRMRGRNRALPPKSLRKTPNPPGYDPHVPRRKAAASAGTPQTQMRKPDDRQNSAEPARRI
jgi:hypothetical protein